MKDAPHVQRDIPGSYRCISLREVTKSLVSLLISRVKPGDHDCAEQMRKNNEKLLKGLPWRVLITDDRGSKVISSLFSKSELRAQGVTLSMFLDSKREQLEEVGAVYLLNVNTHNIEVCARDITTKKYAEYRICFLSLSPIALIEELAKSVATVDNVTNIFISDCPLRYSVLGDNLFTLNSPDCFQLLISSSLKGNEPSSFISTTSEHIFDILRVFDTTPTLAYMPNSLAEHVAHELSKRIQSATKIRVEATSRKKEVLLILDRAYDFLTTLSVPFSYGDLVVEIFTVDSNIIQITEKQLSLVASTDRSEVMNCLSKSGNVYLLDFNCDTLWEDYQGEYFGAVCEHMEKALANFQHDKNKATASVDEFATMMTAAPELVERKLSIDKHTLLSKILLHEIKNRGLDAYHNLCEALIFATRNRRRHDFIEEVSFRVASPSALGDWSDRVRVLCLFTIYAHSVDVNSTGRNVKCAKSLKDELNQLYQNKSSNTSRIVQTVTQMSTQNASLGGEQGGQNTPWQWFDKKITSAAQAITSSLRSEAEDAPLPITEVVAALLYQRPNATALSTRMTSMSLSSVEDISRRKHILQRLRFLEHAQKGGATESQNSDSITCIICILGGYTFREHRDILEWNRKRENAGIHIIFGGSKVISGTKLLAQLGEYC
ncbi:hypothetical protein XU18_5072 [Perkinsela sp. CCAP 1560/4]|nr:hypothetical protein XU18_5072 [Perkinsela sp. CCAP 1560/4]|eukprot:KNH02450.1 hypothetical protein XU18_5072 [Perkinsela sp. CCAP 1560/4]